MLASILEVEVSCCELLDGLAKECMLCRKCDIGGVDMGGTISNVFSNMNAEAKVMVVGQNPGLDEVMAGEPFVGISGKIFDEAMKSIGMSRKQLYISNTVRCYTPKNRKPHQSEIDNCRCFLDKEIEIIKPVLVVALGGHAFKQLTGMNGIMKHHGKIVMSPRYGVPMMPVLHPSPLNTNRPDMKRLFDADIVALKKFLEAEGVG